MHCTYVLLSESTGRFHSGYTGNLRKRLVDHQHGRVWWTAARLPVRLIYYEAA